MGQPHNRTVALLKQHWGRQAKLRLNPPVPASVIDSFEEQYQRTLPAAFWAAYDLADGFAAGHDQDDQGFTFWSLDRVAPVATYEKGRFAFEGSDDWFLFADYLIWCWAYAIHLPRVGSGGAVVMIGTKDDRPGPVASSFEEFVELYVRDDERLYPPE